MGPDFQFDQTADGRIIHATAEAPDYPDSGVRLSEAMTLVTSEWLIRPGRLTHFTQSRTAFKFHDEWDVIGGAAATVKASHAC